MAKDAFWFSHDSNAKEDPKIMILIDQLGLEGYGMFWVLVETLRDQPDYKYPLELVPVLARRYLTSGEKMMTVVKNYNLFQFDEENKFFSFSLINRMQHLEDMREKRILAGIKSGEARRVKSLTEHNLNTCSTDVQHILNKNELSKVKKSKEKYINKEIVDCEIYVPLKEIPKLKKESKLNLSIFSDEEKIILGDWINFRNEIKKPITQTAIELLKKKFNLNGLDYVQKQIEISITNGWQGLFPLKQEIKSIETDFDKINIFYLKEIEKNKSDVLCSDYEQFHRILFGQNSLKSKLTGCLSVPVQVSFEQYKLIDIAKTRKNVKITSMLLTIENDRKYYESKEYLFSVIMAWIDRANDFKK